MEERLQKLIAQAGVASRRKAEEMIEAGEVLVNGNVATLGTKADPDKDHIKVRGKLINARLEHFEKLYLLLNKPVGYITSKADPEGRQLVTDLLGRYRDKVHPVGRLDVNTEGLLLLTNDGQFTQAVAHAAGKVPKVYHVKIKGQPHEKLINKIARGVVLDNVKTHPAEINPIELSETNAWYEVTLYEGRNQQIRKMFKSIGHSVLKLKRVAIGFLRNERLATGEFRELTDAEVQRFFKMKDAPAVKPAKARPLTKDGKPLKIGKPLNSLGKRSVASGGKAKSNVRKAKPVKVSNTAGPLETKLTPRAMGGGPVSPLTNRLTKELAPRVKAQPKAESTGRPAGKPASGAKARSVNRPKRGSKTSEPNLPSSWPGNRPANRSGSSSVSRKAKRPSR